MKGSFIMTNQIMKFCLPVLYLSFMAIPISCTAKEPLLTGGPHYFKSFAGYNIPFHPIDPVSESEAKTLKAYYITFYNDKGKITEFAKFLNGELVFKDAYSYDDKGKLHKRTLTNLSTEKEIIGYFDENGKLIRETGDRPR